ncbi:MAG: ferritin family protein [Deltaproteobacteria bacterium]|nr:ferritin family protein [Deltaproteobacteria bacterium]
MSATSSVIEQLVRQSILAEVAAMTLYTRLANRVTEDEPRRLLRMLAAAEEGHIGRLTDLVTSLGEEGAGALGKVGFVAGLRQEAGKQLDEQLRDLGLSESSTVSELVRFAVRMETKAGGHYERLAVEAVDVRIRDFFAVLVEEEAGHAKQLENLREMLEASAPPS